MQISLLIHAPRVKKIVNNWTLLAIYLSAEDYHPAILIRKFSRKAMIPPRDGHNGGGAAGPKMG